MFARFFNYLNKYYQTIRLYREDELSLRNKRTKKEDDYYKMDSRNLDRGDNSDWDRYKKRSGYSHDKYSKHEKPYRDEMLKVC